MNNNDDIVARLRALDGGYHIRKIYTEAADEIERLHRDYSCICKEMLRMMEERDEARWEVCGFHHLTGFLAGDYAISRGWDYFRDEGKWPKFPPSVTDFQEFLRGQEQLSSEMIARRDARIKELEGLIDSALEKSDDVKKLLNERDEARREVCYLTAELDMINHTSVTAESIALEYEWDCFKEEADHNNEYFRTHHK